MKNLIKISLVALGIISATLMSSSNLLAKQDPESIKGYCNPSTDTVCGVSPAGFIARGFYVTQ